MQEVRLEYALPRRRRLHWHLAVLVVAAVAVAIVGKLCWNKFAGAIATHAAHLRAQTALRSSPAGSALSWSRPPDNGTLAAKQSFFMDKALAERSEQIVPNFAGSIIYHGPLGPADHEQFVHLTVNPTDVGSTTAVTLVVRTFSVGGILTPIAERGGAQILPLLTYLKTCSIDAPVCSGENPSQLVLTGQKDGHAFRYELTINSDNQVQLVEDTTANAPVAEPSTSKP